MTLLFVDSFDHYVTADMAQKGWTNSNATISAGNGRFGTSCLRNTNTTFYAQKGITSVATIITGIAWRSNQVGVSGAVPVVQMFDDGGTAHLTVEVSSSGFVTVKRGGTGGTLLGTGTIPISSDVWYYIEVKATIDDAAGVVVVRVNGATDLNLTSQDTRAGGNAVVAVIRYLSNGSGQGGNYDADDLYICDTNGSTNNDFLGDVRVQAIFPTAEGTTINLTPSTGTDNSALVDEAAPSTTDYVESGVVSDKDTYVFGNLTPTTGTVFGVQILPYAAKTDAGTRSIASIARLSGTEVDSSNKTLSASYTYLPDIRETKPGGGAWSITDVNNAEFGVKVTA